MSVRVLRGSNSLVDHYARLVNGAFDSGFDDRLTCEALTVAHSDVGGENDGVSILDDVSGHSGVVGGALSLNGELDIVALLGGLGKGISSHVGVRDAGGAGRHSDDARLRRLLGIACGSRRGI